MRANRVVHTGPKTQLGGLKGGFTKWLYQRGIFGVVAIVPSEPIISTKKINKNSCIMFLYFMILL